MATTTETKTHEELKALSNKERPDADAKNKKLLWCPFAEIYPKRMPTRGKYPQKYPQGAVVHYTAGRDGTGPIEQGIANGFCYFVITKDGTIHQSFPLDEWGFHAGKSTFRGLGDGVSDNLVGIEVCCAGVVEPVKGTAKFKQWYEVNPEKHLNSAQVRTVPKTSKYPAPGTYERFTEAQEAALKKLLVWLHQNNPAVFSLDLVLGHDEVCVPAGRKTDPGGAISTPMPELRKLLKGLAGVK